MRGKHLMVAYNGHELTDKTVYNFHRDTCIKAKENDIRIYMGRGRRVNAGDTFTMGYFCDTDRVLAVATGDESMSWEDVLGTYVHESCHMDQWIDGTKYWFDSLGVCYEILQKYFNQEPVPLSEIHWALDSIVQLEADCEIRSIKKIKEYGLPIDVERYAQLANGYLYFHSAMLHYKSWYRHPPSTVGVTDTFSKTLYPPAHYRVSKSNINPKIFEPCFAAGKATA